VRDEVCSALHGRQQGDRSGVRRRAGQHDCQRSFGESTRMMKKQFDKINIKTILIKNTEIAT